MGLSGTVIIGTALLGAAWGGCLIFGMSSPATLAASTLASESELRACVAQAALAADRKEDGAQGDQAYLVDGDDDALAKARSYDSGVLAGMTVYHQYLEDGRRTCGWMKLTGQKIEMPKVEVATGCHITRSMGGAAEVCGNEPEPQFSCIDTAHFDGHQCISNDPVQAAMQQSIHNP